MSEVLYLRLELGVPVTQGTGSPFNWSRDEIKQQAAISVADAGEPAQLPCLFWADPSYNYPKGIPVSLPG